MRTVVVVHWSARAVVGPIMSALPPVLFPLRTTRLDTARVRVCVCALALQKRGGQDREGLSAGRPHGRVPDIITCFRPPPPRGKRL